MSIVAISESAGSWGLEIGRAVASTLGYEFADREIIAKTAESFGESVLELTHATQEKPTLWERLTHSQRRYVTYIEATICEMAARDNVVLVGLASTIVLGRVPHALRVRTNASETVRADRIEQQTGLTREAARDHVHQADRERAARVRFLYHVDWDDPSRYDLVLNTERISVATGARIIREVIADERFLSTPSARRSLMDLSAIAQAQATLMATPAVRLRLISVTCAEGTLSITGAVRTEAERKTVLEAMAKIPGVAVVRNGLALTMGQSEEDELSHGRFRHGEERSWGGYGGGGYEREMRRGPANEDDRQGR